MELLTTFTTGLSAAKGVTSLIKDAKELFSNGKTGEGLKAINEAEKQVSELFGRLIDTQRHILEIQEENRHIRSELESRDNWEDRLGEYEVVETEGKAILYESKNTPRHYACPKCIESDKEIHRLQNKEHAGIGFCCPKCDQRYRVSAPRIRKPRTTSPGVEW